MDYLDKAGLIYFTQKLLEEADIRYPKAQYLSEYVKSNDLNFMLKAKAKVEDAISPDDVDLKLLDKADSATVETYVQDVTKSGNNLTVTKGNGTTSTINIKTAAGKNGKSAYQLAVDNGFTGTEQEWLASLKGKDGQAGEAGFSPSVTVAENTDTSFKLYLNNETGTMITPNLKGSRGLQGPPGPEGAPGDPATNLITSVNGQTGAVNLTAADVGAIQFADRNIDDANQWLENGYIKMNAQASNTHLPEECSGVIDKWGILFNLLENTIYGTGSQLFFPIDGRYKGRVFTRALTNAKTSSHSFGRWFLIPSMADIPDVSTFATKEDIASKAEKSELSNLATKAELNAKADSNTLNTKADKSELNGLIRFTEDGGILFPNGIKLVMRP